MRELELVTGRAAHRLYAHVVWPTLGRVPLVSAERRPLLERHLIVLCRRLDVEPLCVRVFADRAHLLLRFKPPHSLAAVVAQLKRGSESALEATGHALRWGRGYAATTVGRDDVRRVRRRIHSLREIPRVAVPRHGPGGPQHRAVPRRMQIRPPHGPAPKTDGSPGA